MSLNFYFYAINGITPAVYRFCPDVAVTHFSVRATFMGRRGSRADFSLFCSFTALTSTKKLSLRLENKDYYVGTKALIHLE